MAAFAEDVAQDFGDGKDELAVGDFVPNGGGDPLAGGADAALVAGEAGGEVAATEKGLDGGDGVGAEWAEGFSVVFFVTSEEVVPFVVDELPKGRGAGTAGLVDGRHKKCS